MRKARIGWRLGFAGAGLVAAMSVAAVAPSLLTHYRRSRSPLARLVTSLVRRTDLSVTMTTGGRVDSSERTVIECQLERLDAGLRGNNISAGGASTVLSVVPDGSVVKKGDVLCELDSSDYEELVRQQAMTVERSRSDHRQAELTLDVARMALDEYRDGVMKQAVESMEVGVSLAESERQRALDRLSWTRRMFQKGYAPKGQVTTEEFGLAKLQSAADDGRENLRLFRRFFAPKYLHILKSDISGAEAVLNYQAARLGRNRDRLNLFKQQVERCTIRAPHDGLLIYANEERRSVVIEPGMAVRQRQKLFFLPDLAHMEVAALLHESVVRSVKAGMTARVWVEGLSNRTMEGHVESVEPLPMRPEGFSDVKYFVGKVKLDAVPAGLKPGMSAEVSIRTVLRPDVLAVPPEAVTIEDGREVCYVAFDDHVERREVKLGQQTKDLLEITDGLDEGEAVVLDPSSAESAPGIANAERTAPGEPETAVAP